MYGIRTLYSQRNFCNPNSFFFKTGLLGTRDLGLFPAFGITEGDEGPAGNELAEFMANAVKVRGGRRLVLLEFKGVPANGKSSSISLSF